MGSNRVIRKKDIYDRIERYYRNGWIKNSDQGNNDLACDLFGHPDNYVPILEKYPKLRICLAHMGGSAEVIGDTKAKDDLKILRKIWAANGDGTNWFQRIHEMMKRYKNMYTDISYTLSDLDKPEVTKTILDFMEEKDDAGNP